MYTKQALRILGVSDDDVTTSQKAALATDGYFTVENVFSKKECAEMAEAFEKIHAEEKENGGHEVHVEPGARRVVASSRHRARLDRGLGPKGQRPSAGTQRRVCRSAQHAAPQHHHRP